MPYLKAVSILVGPEIEPRPANFWSGPDIYDQTDKLFQIEIKGGEKIGNKIEKV